MPTTSSPPTSGPTRVTRTYAARPMTATSSAPPMPTTAGGSPSANVVTSPDLGSTREIRPAAPSVTYSAPSGPTVLPEAPSNPVTSRVAVGPPDWGGSLGACGVVNAVRAAADTTSVRTEATGPSSPHVVRSGDTVGSATPALPASPSSATTLSGPAECDLRISPYTPLRAGPLVGEVGTGPPGPTGESVVCDRSSTSADSDASEIQRFF